jgi:fucose permease
VSVFLLSCLAYLGVALSGSTLGMLWPSMRLSIHQPVGALGIVLIAGVAASALSSTVTGRILPRAAAGSLLAGGAALVGAALAAEAAAPGLWLIVAGSAVFSTGFGVINTVLNAYAAARFGPRHINWMHASYGLGATLGPLLITAMLSSGASWRFAFGSLAAVMALIALVLAAGRRAWAMPSSDSARGSRRISPEAAHASEDEAAPGTPRRRRRGVPAGVVFTAVETGAESAAGIWGYVFLTSGRGLPDAVAGVAVSAYWAMMFAGRAVLGPVAERAGASRVLAAAVAGIPAGAMLMTVPGPGFVAVAGMLLLGLAAAPVFPLITLTTADRVGAGGASAAVGLQMAASAVGSAALPSGVGLAIGAVSARALAPALLLLGLAMCVVYWLALRPSAGRGVSR